jgi:hypothetical protein
VFKRRWQEAKEASGTYLDEQWKLVELQKGEVAAFQFTVGEKVRPESTEVCSTCPSNASTTHAFR